MELALFLLGKSFLRTRICSDILLAISKMSLIEILQEKDYKGILFRAIEILTDPKEIVQFYHEYTAYLGDPKRIRKSHLATIDPGKAAITNIAYTLQYYDPVTHNRWLGALPELTGIFNEINTPNVHEIINNLNDKMIRKSPNA